jgi:hypothetical protein
MFSYQRVKALISGTTAIDITDRTDRRVILMYLIMSLLTALFTGSAIYHLIAGDPRYVIGALLIAPTGLLPLLYFRKTKAFAEASRLGAIALFVGLIAFVLIHEGRDYSLIWTIFVPLYVCSWSAVAKKACATPCCSTGLCFSSLTGTLELGKVGTSPPFCVLRSSLRY